METNLLKWHHYSHIRTVSYSFHSSTVFLGGFHCHSQLCTYLLFCFYFVHVYIGLTTWTNKVIIECNVTKDLASLLRWSSTLDDYRMFGKWYFVTKIVLTYCEKKLFYWSRKTFEILGWRLTICKNFEITKTIYSNSERSEQFLVTECFLTSSWRFLIPIKLEKLELELEKKYWDLETCRKSYKKNNIWPCHWTKLIGFGRWSIQKNRSLSSLKVPFLIILVLVPLS